MKRKRILILCPSPKGTNPGQRLKYEQYITSWGNAGYDITISSFQTPRFWKIIYKPGYYPEKILLTLYGYLKRIMDLFRIPFYDGVYVYMAITPFGPPVFEWLVRKLSKAMIFDLEDMAFMHHVSKANRFIGRLKGRRKLLYLMKVADHVVVCTPTLEQFARQYTNHVTDISATFNMQRFLPVNLYQKKEVTTIGWTGSHSTIPYLHLLDDVFREVAKLRRIKVLCICNVDYVCEGVEVENIGWTEANEISDLQKIDIGVYPVPMEQWVLGKSGCKAITYMSIGVPAVATAFGTVFRVIEDGVNGLLVRDKDEWVQALIRLIDDVELREKLGRAGREKVIAEFSLEANTGRYLMAFEQAYGKV